MNGFVAALGALNTTNARICVTLIWIGATAVRFLVWGVPPNAADHWNSWLVFLGTLAGVDAAQYLTKRVTYRSDAPDATSAPVAPPCAPSGTTSPAPPAALPADD